MGQSTNAVLAYGYDLGRDEDWKMLEIDEDGVPTPSWYDDDNDEDDFVEQAKNHLLANAGFAEADWDAEDWSERHDAATARVDVEFKTYCHGEYPMYVLATKAITVRRGYSKVLDLAALAADPIEHGWDDKLTAALTVLGITPKQEKPGWVLCSYWG
ncbi:hypothetical protein [Streptosporangium vulgare]|uniref:Uncharacterized protein n=1 Tax=Streptosporangium vulgare TaxID=46190 RepID=A0ABV5TQ87_9ACTN